MRLSPIIMALALVASPALAKDTKWLGSWGASPAPPTADGPGIEPRRLAPSFSNQTLAQVVRLSAGGSRLRVRFTNEYGRTPLMIGGARVELIRSDGTRVAGSERVVTFGGATAASVPAGAPMLSDPVALPTDALARLKVSLYLPGDTGPCTCHMNGNERIQVSPAGNWMGKDLPVAAGPAQYRAFLSGVDVERGGAAVVIVPFGDSITDGYLSTVGANRRWPDRLAERLAKAYPKRAMAVVNAGIGGNRVLSDGFVPSMGQSALTRFDRDVLAVAGATHVVILEGVNDLGMSRDRPTAQMLILGYRQLIARAHARGLKAIGATILPYEGAGYFTAEGEQTRQVVNAWIRTSKGFDAVIDLDAAIRDPAKPIRMRADFQSGDWLHPNDAGYAAMGDAVDLGLFK